MFDLENLTCGTLKTTWLFQKHVDWIKAVIDRTYEIVVEHPELPSKGLFVSLLDSTWCIMFQSLMADGAAIKRACIAITDDVAKVFNHCAEGEWIDPDDSDKNTLNHRLCKTIMEDFVLRVIILPFAACGAHVRIV